MKITDCGFFVIRTPLLPFSEALLWGDALTCSKLRLQGADARIIEQAWHDDVVTLRARLRELIQRPAVIQALAIASPSLQQAVAIWKDNPDCKKGLQAERAIVRYFLRMTGRSTPFGLFSGCSLGSVGVNAATKIVLASNKHYRSATRLDFDYLFALTEALRRDTATQTEMRYVANSSLHRIADSWHYVESRLSEVSRSHHLVKLSGDEYLDSVLASAKSSHRSFSELMAVIDSCKGSESLSKNEIRDYLHELIDSEVIVPSIVPVITGRPPLDSLLEELQDLPSAKNVYRVLVDVRTSLSELDKRPLDVRPEEYDSIMEQLEQLPAKVDKARVLQVDLFKPIQSAHLGRAVLDEIAGALNVLSRITIPVEPPDLVRFRDAFVERYERQWVSLVEALDVEAGIGYGVRSAAADSPLLQEMPLIGVEKSADMMTLNKFQSFLLQKVLDCARTGKEEVNLQQDDLPPEENVDELLPESFSVIVSLVSKSAEALEGGDFELLFRGGTGPSCARSLGRFCSADPDLEASVVKALREEEAQDAECVYAEIVYLPEGRIGNVLCRPALRDYEIVYLGRSGVEADKQLSADDLLLAVRDGKVLLYSKKLNRRIIPRLSNAHNYSSPTLSPIYRFLCDLQNQGGVLVPHFKWGAMATLNALPRLRAGRVVLSRAQWRLSSAETQRLHDIDRYTAFVLIKELQQRRGLPQWVLLVEDDNLLPVDLDNPLSVDSLVHLLKRSPEATLVEMYPQFQNQSVSGPEGAYEHELVIPLTNRRPVPPQNSGGRAAPDRVMHQIKSSLSAPRSERLLPPGSDWHFVKIYGGSAMLNELLTKHLGPLVSALVASGVLRRWFFVRYEDPEMHLRLRFQTLDVTAYRDLSRALQLLLVDRNTWKIQFDTYHREIERYGGLEGVEASEEMFCADSEAALTIMQALNAGEASDMPWKIALFGIDSLCTDCGLGIDDKVRLMSRLRDSFAHEFHLLSSAKEKLGIRFRRERDYLESMLCRDDPSEHSPALEVAAKAFALRSERTRSAIARLRELDEGNALTTSFLDIVASHMHMSVNRMVQSSPRVHELLIYNFLYRIYDGINARTKRMLLS